VWPHRGLRKFPSVANELQSSRVSVYWVGVDGFPPPLRSWCGYRLCGPLWGHSVARAVAGGVVAVSFGAVWADTDGFVPGSSDSIGSDGCVWAWIDLYLTPLGCGCRCDRGRTPGIGWATWGPDSGNPSPDAVGNRSMARTISQVGASGPGMAASAACPLHPRRNFSYSGIILGGWTEALLLGFVSIAVCVADVVGGLSWKASIACWNLVAS
jgi:hypothetical protein